MLIATMRDKILIFLLVAALGVIAFDRVTEHATTVKAASRTLTVHTFSTMFDSPLPDGRDTLFMKTDGSVAGFSCTGTGNQAKCYVLMSED